MTYDEKRQDELRKAFECILNACPFKQVENLKPRLPSKSTRRRLRKKAARSKTQKPPLHQIKRTTQNSVNTFLTSMQPEDSPEFHPSGPRFNHFSSIEKPPDSGNTSTPHLSDSTRIDQVSDEVHRSPAEAGIAAPIISQAVSHYTQEVWDNSVMSMPIQLYAPSEPVLIEDPTQHKISDSQHAPPAPSQFPVYNPLDDSALASIPSQFPGYHHLENSAPNSVPSQYPNYNPLGMHCDYTINPSFSAASQT